GRSRDLKNRTSARVEPDRTKRKERFARSFVQGRMRNQRALWMVFVCLGGSAFASKPPPPSLLRDVKDPFGSLEPAPLGLGPVSTRRATRARRAATSVASEPIENAPAPFRPWLAGASVAVDAHNGEVFVAETDNGNIVVS